MVSSHRKHHVAYQLPKCTPSSQGHQRHPANVADALSGAAPLHSCKFSSHRKALINIFHGTRCARRTQAACRALLLVFSLKPFSNNERRPIDPGRGRESVLYTLVHVVTSKHFFEQHNCKSEFVIVCTHRSSVSYLYLQLRSEQLTVFFKGHIHAGQCLHTI